MAWRIFSILENLFTIIADLLLFLESFLFVYQNVTTESNNAENNSRIKRHWRAYEEEENWMVSICFSWYQYVFLESK